MAVALKASLGKVVVAHESGKGSTPVDADEYGVKGLEIPVHRLMKGDHNRHHFAQAQTTGMLTVL